MRFLNYKERVLHIIAVIIIMAASLNPAYASALENIELILKIDGVSQTYIGPKQKLVVNGMEMNNLELPPINLDGQTFVPASEILKSLGAITTWNDSFKELFVNLFNKPMIIQINNDNVNINGTLKKMPAAPKMINDKVMVPLRFFDDGLAMTVTWDDINKIIYIWDNTLHVPTETPKPTATPVTGSSTYPPLTYEALVEADLINEYPTPIYGTENLPDSLIAERASDISLAPIESKSFPNTKIIGLTLPEGNDNSFIITASSEISVVDKILLPDNRIVIDIQGAEFALDQGTYTVSHPNVSQVRVAQNQVDPVLITRVVFDIKAASDFSVAISADRKSIIVSFQRNAVVDIKFESDGKRDIITLSTQSHAILNVYPVSDPQRIVIDIPNSDMLKKMDENVSGRFAKTVRSGIFESHTARIELDVSSDASYEIQDMGNTISIILTEPTYKNIEYDTDTHIIKFAKANGIFIDINAIELKDEYNDLKYTLTLPANFEKSIGYGEYMIKDDYLRSIIVKTVDGRTQITLLEKRILALTIYDDSTYVYIKLLEPREKYDKIVIIDPGHGGRDPGTDGFGLLEKDIVLDISKKVMALLKTDGSVKAYATRLSDVYPDREERVEFGNMIGADLFVSVHVNAVENDPSVNGTEVYYYPHDNDAIIGYSGFDAAKIFQRNLVEKLGTRDRKVKEESYIVIKYNNMPAVLVETAFISNQAEAGRLATDYFRMQAADAIYISIIDVFKEYKPKR